MSHSWVAVLGLWCVAAPAWGGDECKALGVGESPGSRIAISTEVHPVAGPGLTLTLELTSGLPQFYAKTKSGKPAAVGAPAVLEFSGGLRGTWTYAPSSSSVPTGTYLFTPLDKSQLELLSTKPLMDIQLPLATGGHDDFMLDKDNQKTLMDGAKCVISRLGG